MAVIHLPYGIEGTLDLEIEDKNLVLDTDVSFPEEISSMDQAVLDALDHPVEGASFSERLRKAQKVIILMDNWARLTPAHKILPPILKRIRDEGKEVEIMVANGLLREMTESELKRKFGDEILSVDGKPFTPIAAFHGKIGQSVDIEIRRTRGAEAQSYRVPVVPIMSSAVFSAARYSSKPAEPV